MAQLDIDDLPEFTVAADDKSEPPKWAQEEAARVIEKAGIAVKDRVQTIDPTLLWTLAKIIASIVVACADSHITSSLNAVSAKPSGLFANRLHGKLTSKMPKSWGGDRKTLAKAMIENAKEAKNDSARWANVSR